MMNIVEMKLMIHEVEIKYSMLLKLILRAQLNKLGKLKQILPSRLKFADN